MKEKNKKEFKSMLNKKNGITLIALVITIIVMLILVGVTINMAVNGGLFGYAENAAHDTELAKQDEQKIAEGGIEIDGKKYDSPKDFIDGIESGEPVPYSPNLLDSTTKVLTKTAIYTDSEDTATIPKGYAIVEGCETIKEGLVIQDKDGNEFVWIPVPEKDMKVATISDQYTGGTNYAEPKELTSMDSNTNSATGGPYAYDSQVELDYYYGTGYFTYPEDVSDETNVTDFLYGAHYKEMAESVNKYGGFYIGRYETTIDSNNKIGSKYNTPILTSNKTIKPGTNTNNNQPYYYRWWGLYYACRHSNVEGNGRTIQTNMIWGQEWDKMISYIDSKSINYDKIDITNTYNNPQTEVVNSGTARYTPKEGVTNAEEMNDKIFNIYDLRMNAGDWTAEGYGVRHKLSS